MELAEKLIQLRKKKGLSRREVAEATGISENTYKKYEIPDSDKFSVRPPYERLCTLADFYGVTTDYLLGREPPPNPLAELKLSPDCEKDMLEKYMSLPPDVRECAFDLLQKLGSTVNSITDDVINTIMATEKAFKKIQERVPDKTNIVPSAAEPKDKYHDLLKKSGAEMTDEEIELTAELYKKGLREEKEAAEKSSASSGFTATNTQIEKRKEA